MASLNAAVGPLEPAQEVEVRQLLEGELHEALVTVAAIRFTVAEPGEATATESAAATAI